MSVYLGEVEGSGLNFKGNINFLKSYKKYDDFLCPFEDEEGRKASYGHFDWIDSKEENVPIRAGS